tara:strand:- start:706 stop:1785 length:1080 start_codon:yes stop_codon:yes gene_type:complete
MNDKGDFYIGNTKISADSGEQVTFDIPIPTVTGEDPSKLSVVFDEVIVKERLLVEGGASKQILSQFDGPVTFNAPVRFNADLNLTKKLSVKGVVSFLNEKEATVNCTNETVDAGFNVSGGVGILKNLHVCKEIKTFDETQSESTITGALTAAGGLGIGKNAYIGGLIDVTGNANFKGNVDLGDAGTDTISFLGKIDTDLLPTGDAEKDLGSAANTWNVLHTDTIQTRKIAITGNEASTSKTTGALTVGGGVGILGDLNVGGDITAFATSDGNLKKDIAVIEDPLAKVLNLEGVTYTWNEKSTKEGERDTGVIAQDVDKLGLPGITTTRDDGTMAVNYDKLVPILIGAIKELSAKVDALS